MKSIKKYLLTISSIAVSLIVLTLVLTLLYYFDFISTNTYKYYKIIIIVLALLTNSILLGRNSIKNGYLDGIKLGIMLIIFCTLVSIVQKNISLKLILYNFIILISSTLGSMIGINTKKEKTD